MIEMHEGTHGVEDILLGFEPKDAGSIPAGSVPFTPAGTSCAHPGKTGVMKFFRYTSGLSTAISMAPSAGEASGAVARTLTAKSVAATATSATRQDSVTIPDAKTGNWVFCRRRFTNRKYEDVQMCGRTPTAPVRRRAVHRIRM